METQIKLTKLASCAGCGAKVGAGTLAAMLEGFRTHTDPRLIVGYGKSDDACVYVVDPQTALVQTTDFFSPIVDDPFLYGQIAAANALSDVYAMGGEPKLALNILCLPETIEAPTRSGSCCGAATTRFMRQAPSLPADIPFTALGPFTAWRSPASACWATALRWPRAAAAPSISRQIRFPIIRKRWSWRIWDFCPPVPTATAPMQKQASPAAGRFPVL